MNKNTRLFLIGGLLIALSLAFFVSPLASTKPDGLNKVASDKGFDRNGTDHALKDGPLAGYEVKGVRDERLGKGLAGVIGVIMTFGIGSVLFAAIRWRRERQTDSSALTTSA